MTAEFRPGRIDAISDEQLVKVARYIGAEADAGHSVYLRPELGKKLADAILEVLNRKGDV